MIAADVGMRHEAVDLAQTFEAETQVTELSFTSPRSLPTSLFSLEPPLQLCF